MRKRRAEALLLIFALGLGGPVSAITVSEDFSTLGRRGTATLVWNSVRGQLHPPLQVYQYDDGVPADLAFDVGTGEHGEFVLSRYAEFSQNGDVSLSTIRLDLSVYPTLEVTNFTLESGWTLQPIGDQPLIIKALGDITIDGVIDCRGEDGEDLNGDPNTPTAGGIGHCGGGDGGAGASLTTAAEDGTVGGPIIIGGAGGGVDGPTVGTGATLTESGGGGGGAYAVSRGAVYDPEDGSGAGPGSAGEMGQDNAFTVEGGGFGGGGGGYYNLGGVGIDSAGAAGGGGGGTIFITAAGNINVNGAVLANGGKGGDVANTFLGGGGGGGGGGSIAMFAGGEVTLSATPALPPGISSSVEALGGEGRGPAATRGGNGSAGRTWLTGTSGFALGGPPFEDPFSALVYFGDVRYRLGLFEAVSAEIDLGNSAPVLTTAALVDFLPVGSTVQLDIATGADSGFTPSWTDTAGVPLSLSRFGRFRIQLTNSDLAAPATVDTLTLTLTGFEQPEFKFIAGCGSVSDGLSSNKYLIFILIPLLTYLRLRLPSPARLKARFHRPRRSP